MLFHIANSILILFSAAVAGWFFCFAEKEKFRTAFIAFPRSRKIGIPLTAVILFALIPHVEQLMEPGSFFLQYHLVRIGAVLFFVLIALYADFILARALSVAMIFSAWLLLRESYALALPCHAVYAVAIFLLGITGIVISAKPVWMRDWITKAMSSPLCRYISGSAFLVLTLIAVITGIWELAVYS